MSELTEQEQRLIEEYRRRQQAQQYYQPPQAIQTYRQVNWKPVATTFLLITILLAGSTLYLFTNNITTKQDYNNLNIEYSAYKTKVNNFMTHFNITDNNGNLDVMLTRAQLLLSTQDNRISHLQKYELRNPTEEELTLFLRLDDTNEKYYNEYDPYTGKQDDFVCLEYATKLYNRAKESGIRMSFIASNYKYGESRWDMAAHAFNSVKLFNGTTVWIEPQKDRVLNSPEELLAKIEKVTIENIKILNYGEMWPSGTNG